MYCNVFGNCHALTKLPITNGFGYFWWSTSFQLLLLWSAVPAQSHNWGSQQPIGHEVIHGLRTGGISWCLQHQRLHQANTQHNAHTCVTCHLASDFAHILDDAGLVPFLPATVQRRAMWSQTAGEQHGYFNDTRLRFHFEGPVFATHQKIQIYGHIYKRIANSS